MIPLCRSLGVGLVPWSPLARGLLARGAIATTTRTGNDPLADRMYGTSDDLAVVDALTAVAAERGLPPAQVALAWLRSKPGVTAPIVGITKPRHLADAVASVDVDLTSEEIEQLEAPYRPHGVLGHA